MTSEWHVKVKDEVYHERQAQFKEVVKRAYKRYKQAQQDFDAARVEYEALLKDDAYERWSAKTPFV